MSDPEMTSIMLSASHNQVSGSGEFDQDTGGIINEIMTATGQRASHEFHCSLPPFYIMPDGTSLLTVTLFVKPVYYMSDRGSLPKN